MSEYLIPEENELFGWCSSCDKLVMASQLDLEQVEAIEGAECPTCGDYLITKENEDTEKLIERIAKQDAQIKRLLEEMDKPVSDEEMQTHALHHMRLGTLNQINDMPVLTRTQVQALIAARRKAVRDERERG